ncbi:unnamed protein product [Brachionus calyciflorus]|uniref:Phospholipid scramblase n=1 Tax=Brachionus calyciflorus TaxID=104777 RepID=A0A814ASK8_9BILA|nr:unnamed protein product [Brachionus calyciflorus]
MSIPMTNLATVTQPLIPGQMVWMQRPNPIPGCPNGLEYLLMIDNIKAEQLVSLTEAFVGWETNNKYVLKNSAGMQLYYAFESII